MFEDLNPMDKTTAVLEIVIMLFVAFLIGVLTMWLARKKNQDQNQLPDKKNKELRKQIEDANLKIEKLSADNATLLNEKKEFQGEVKNSEHLKGQLLEYEDKQAKLQEEIAQLKIKNHTTEDELHEQEKLNYELQHKLKRPAPKFSSKEEAAEALGFKLAKEEDKEDLTVIKGVGPFIQEKLNELGIYTIEQISDFTIDTVIKVTEAIEYFPGRIQRDFWVEQANQIMDDRVKKEYSEKA